MSDLLAMAERAARAAGVIIEAAMKDRAFRVMTKSRADYVTEVDLAAERAIVAIIGERFPQHAILGEEGGAQPGKASGGGPSAWRWVIDPLDGTTNFIRDIPFHAVAVSVEEAGVPAAAAILDTTRGHLYAATRGGGATRDGAPIHVSAEEDVASAIVCTGIPFRSLGILPTYLHELERVALASAGIRRMGSAALDLCHVAAGRTEAFWEHGLGRWDISAGALLVEEAGGRVTDLTGGSGHLDTGDVLATNGRVHDALLACLA